MILPPPRAQASDGAEARIRAATAILQRRNAELAAAKAAATAAAERAATLETIVESLDAAADASPVMSDGAYENTPHTPDPLFPEAIVAPLAESHAARDRPSLEDVLSLSAGSKPEAPPDVAPAYRPTAYTLTNPNLIRTPAPQNARPFSASGNADDVVGSTYSHSAAVPAAADAAATAAAAAAAAGKAGAARGAAADSARTACAEAGRRRRRAANIVCLGGDGDGRAVRARESWCGS